jgi:SAM-dependent methyltransferase
MTGVQRFANEIRARLPVKADWQRISQRASATAIPWSRHVLAMRLQNQAEMLGDYLIRGENVLDVGCGTGYLAQYLDEMFAAKLTGVDVKDFSVAPIDFHQFDGVSIPFPNGAFDHIVLSFVLHHSYDPMTLIQECHRVARRSIIVFEDLPDSRFGRLLVSLHVGIFQRFYRLKSPRSDYRSALVWLGDKAANVVRTLMPFEWFDFLYRVPRFLLVYELSDD